MFRCLTNIIIVQQPTADYPNRTATLTFDYIHEFESSDSWADFTNKAKITLPKNLYYRDAAGTKHLLGTTGVGETDYTPIGGFSTNAPLFMKGDTVSIEYGYIYPVLANDLHVTNNIFKGYISKVTSKKPIVLECEDNMWKLKQIIAPNKTYTADQTLEDILKDLLQGTGFTVNALTQTSLGPFTVQNETVMDVIARIRKDYHFESYFKGNELRCGVFVYIEQDAIDAGRKVFRFQQNIISDDLSYMRKDDINLSAVAYSVNKTEVDGMTADGYKKTRRERLEILVTQQKGKFLYKVKAANQPAEFAPATAGLRPTLHFWNVNDPETLANMAIQWLQKYYYDGFRGKFTTFALPKVSQGDNVDIYDNILPERNGRYKVKSVTYTGGVNGHRQEIELDYLVAKIDDKGNVIGTI
jgi:hypothetical protein